MGRLCSRGSRKLGLLNLFSGKCGEGGEEN